MMGTSRPVGELLREWRVRRRVSQLDLALEAEISPKHVSFVETGRAQPSREMIIRLAEHLQIPLRDRNTLLHAGGFAAVYHERPLSDPALCSARAAVDLVLKGHEPFPAVAVDRHWTLVAANGPAGALMESVDPALLDPPVNVLRLTLHPAGLAPRIANLVEWRHHLLERLKLQVDATGDAVLTDLLAELRGYPVPPEVLDAAPPVRDYAGVVIPFELRTPAGVLSFFGTTTVFGTPIDITLAELALESFFPANARTAEVLRMLAASRDPGSGVLDPSEPLVPSG
jgi:transcriptional regulator with XRE-family HTH domain